MRRANATRATTAFQRRDSSHKPREFHFRRDWLPNPTEYFQAQRLKPIGAGRESHTSASGSARVRQCRNPRCEGNRVHCSSRRALRTLTPTLAAAAC